MRELPPFQPATRAVEVRRRGVTRLCGGLAEHVTDDGTPVCWWHAKLTGTDAPILFTHPDPRMHW